MSDQAQDQKKTTLKNRAPVWFDVKFNRKQMIHIFKEGHRVRSLLIDLGRSFKLDQEWDIWRQKNIPPELLGEKNLHLSMVVAKIAFADGTDDAEEHFIQADDTKDMFGAGDNTERESSGDDA